MRMGETKASLMAMLSALAISACTGGGQDFFDEKAMVLDSCVTTGVDGAEVVRQVYLRDAMGRDTLMLYYGAGVLTGEQRTVYDSCGKITRILLTLPMGKKDVRFFKKESGQTAHVETDESGVVETVILEYDGERIVREEWSEAMQLFEYDSAGRVTAVEMHGPTQGGDGQKALQTKTVSQYDETGNEVFSALLAATDTGLIEVSRSENEYDAKGLRIVSMQAAGDVRTKSVYTYDEAGNIVEGKTYVIDNASGALSPTARTAYAYGFDPLWKEECDFAYDTDGRESLTLRKVSYFSAIADKKSGRTK